MSAGLAPFGALSPADIARLMQQARPQTDGSADDVPAAIPPGFTGFVPPTAPTMQPPGRLAVAPEPEAPVRAPLRMFGALPPDLSAPAPAEPDRSPLPSLVGSQVPSMAGRAPVAPRADDAARAAPAPARPLTFGSLPASPPAAPATTGAVPIAPTSAAPAASPSASEPSFLDRIGSGLRDVATDRDLLMNLGIGLMSTPGWGQGAAVGLKGYQDSIPKRAAADLARAEYGLKAQKAQQEAGATNATAQAIAEKLNVPYERALAFASDKDFVNSFIKGTYGTAATKATAQALAEGAAAGAKDDVQLQQLPDGRLVAVNKSNLFPAQGEDAKLAVAQVAASAGVTPLTMPNDRLRAGIRQDDNRAAWQKPDGTVTFEPQPASTTINMPPAEKAEQAKIGEARGNVVADQITAGKSAQDRVRTLDQMSGALSAAGGNITTGPLGEPVLRAKQALGGLLGRELPGTSATEMFNNMGPILAGEAARAITNRPAQIEFTTMLNSKPGLMNSVEGNRAMMDVMRQRAVQDSELANIAARSTSTDEFLRKKDEYEAAHPMTNPFTGQPFGSASAPGADAGGEASSSRVVQVRSAAERDGLPTGARYIAPDGKLRIKQ